MESSQCALLRLCNAEGENPGGVKRMEQKAGGRKGGEKDQVAYAMFRLL